MLVYRVCPYLPGAPAGAAGHPLHLGEQGSGRLDNPGHYRVWYLALEPSGAVGEAFGDLEEWHPGMFKRTAVSGSRLALVTYRLNDDVRLLDLDDSRNLLARGLRPTQVMERNRAVTQAWALSVYNERNDRGARVWQGIKWWSYHRSQWRVVGYWGEKAPHLLATDQLTLASPAVTDAATALKKRCSPLRYSARVGA